MKSYDTTGFARAHFTVGYAKVSEVVPPIVFTLLVFGFYMANYAWSTGFFTNAFTPLLASLSLHQFSM